MLTNMFISWEMWILPKAIICRVKYISTQFHSNDPYQTSAESFHSPDGHIVDERDDISFSPVIKGGDDIAFFKEYVQVQS